MYGTIFTFDCIHCSKRCATIHIIIPTISIVCLIHESVCTKNKCMMHEKIIIKYCITFPILQLPAHHNNKSTKIS